MSSPNRRKIHLRHPVVVDMGCSCRKSRLASLLSSLSSSCPKPKPKPSHFSTTTTTSSSSSSVAAFCAASSGADSSARGPSFASSLDETASPPPPLPQRRAKKARIKKKNGRRVERESVAVVKETSEPYSEFKDSMVQMIMEKEIYGWEDLNDLLHRFLSLNSPRHHHLILRAFADLWNGVFSPPSPLAGGDDYAPLPYY